MDLRNIINQADTTIIDVRAPFEYVMGHVTGAKNIPLGDILNRIEEIRQLGGPIVVYCRSGARSGQAMAFLRAQGIREVYNGGGLQDVEAYLENVC